MTSRIRSEGAYIIKSAESRPLRESELRERMQSAKPRPPAVPTARDKALVRALLARKESA